MSRPWREGAKYPPPSIGSLYSCPPSSNQPTLPSIQGFLSVQLNGYSTSSRCTEQSITKRKNAREGANTYVIRTLRCVKHIICYILLPFVAQFLLGTINKQPDLYLDELQEMLEVNCGRSVSCSTVWRVLRKGGLTLKKVNFIPWCYALADCVVQMTRKAAERSAEKRLEFLDRISNIRKKTRSF
jgi:hypothetical protein